MLSAASLARVAGPPAVLVYADEGTAGYVLEDRDAFLADLLDTLHTFGPRGSAVANLRRADFGFLDAPGLPKLRNPSHLGAKEGG